MVSKCNEYFLFVINEKNIHEMLNINRPKITFNSITLLDGMDMDLFLYIKDAIMVQCNRIIQSLRKFIKCIPQKVLTSIKLKHFYLSLVIMYNIICIKQGLKVHNIFCLTTEVKM